MLGVVAHACHHNLLRAETGRLWVQGQLLMYTETLSKSKSESDNIYPSCKEEKHLTGHLLTGAISLFISLFVNKVSHIAQASLELITALNSCSPPSIP